MKENGNYTYNYSGILPFFKLRIKTLVLREDTEHIPKFQNLKKNIFKKIASMNNLLLRVDHFTHL